VVERGERVRAEVSALAGATIAVAVSGCRQTFDFTPVSAADTTLHFVRAR
jgi:hypothetical protein